MKLATRVLGAGAVAALILPLSSQMHATYAASRMNACASAATLRFQGPSGADQENKLVQKGLDQFQARNPCIKVNYQSIPDAYPQKLRSEFASGDQPDVFFLSPDLMATYPQNNKLLKMDSYLAADKINTKDFIPALLSQFQIKGVTYGIPKDWGTLGVFYNKSIFDAKHIAYPSNNMTYQQYRDLAKKLYTPNSNPSKVIYGTMMPSDNGRFSAFLYGFGTQIFDPLTNKVLLDPTKATQALDYYTSFVTKDHSATLPATTGDGWQGDSFGKGRVAMVIEGGWLNPPMADKYKTINYGVAEMPIGPAGRGNCTFTNAWSVAATTKYPAQAVKLVEFLTSKDYQHQVLLAGFALPSRTDLLNDPFLKGHPEVGNLFDQYKDGKSFNWGQYNDVVNTALGNAIDYVRTGKKAPAAAIADAVKNINNQTQNTP